MINKTFKHTLLALIIGGVATAHAATPSSVSDNGNDGNVAANTIDDDANFSTRWSAKGNDGTQWVKYDFSSATALSGLKIAFYKGDQRSTYFKIQSSNDGSSWSTVVDKSSAGSSGSSAGLETFLFSSDVSARYFRIQGLGNSDGNEWNSITDVEFIDGDSSTPVTDPDPDPVTSTDFDWDGWKVTMPVNGDTYYGDGNTSSAAELQPSACTEETFDEELANDYFWSDSEGLHFKVPMNLDGKTPNTSYIRSELRELHDWSPCETTSTANWAYGGEHSLDATLRIDDFNASSTKVVVGQIHGHDVKYATIKVHWEGDSKPIRVIYNTTPDSSSSESVNLGYVDSSTFWSYNITMTDTGIDLTAGGVTETLTFGDELSNDWKDETFYFKAGLYPQEKPSSSSTDIYEATFSTVTVAH